MGVCPDAGLAIGRVSWRCPQRSYAKNMHAISLVTCPSTFDTAQGFLDFSRRADFLRAGNGALGGGSTGDAAIGGEVHCLNAGDAAGVRDAAPPKGNLDDLVHGGYMYCWTGKRSAEAAAHHHQLCLIK